MSSTSWSSLWRAVLFWTIGWLVIGHVALSLAVTYWPSLRGYRVALGWSNQALEAQYINWVAACGGHVNVSYADFQAAKDAPWLVTPADSVSVRALANNGSFLCSMPLNGSFVWRWRVYPSVVG